MKIHFLIPIALVLAGTCSLGTVQGVWQSGRIVEVQKSVDSKPLYWIANTPVTKDETTYRITVQLGQRLIVGVYTLDKLQGAPPNEWVHGHPVKLQLNGDDMYLKPISGDEIKLRIVKRKVTSAMKPVTEAEMKEAYAPPPSPESLTGFADSDAKESKPEPKQEADQLNQRDSSKASQTVKETSGPVGVIDVTTVPYLAEIYIDGASVGYSPAKFTLPVGKHLLRAQKDGYQAWSKDVTVLESSEFTVYAELKKK